MARQAWKRWGAFTAWGLLLQSGRAHANCVLDSLETVVTVTGQGTTRSDEWRWYVGSGQPDCQRVFIPADPGQVLQDVRIRVRRDRGGHRAGAGRVFREAGGVAGGAGWWVHLPEARQGDQLIIHTRRRSTQRAVRWTAAGAGWASLRVRGQDVQAWMMGERWAPVDPAQVAHLLWSPDSEDKAPDVFLGEEPPPPPAPPPVRDTHVEEVSTTLRLDPSWGTARDTGALFESVRRVEILGPDPHGADRVVPIPEDAVDAYCGLSVDGQEQPVDQRADACVFEVEAPPGARLDLSWGWGLPGMPLFGERDLIDDQPVDLFRLVIEGPGLDLVVGTQGPVGRAQTGARLSFTAQHTPARSADQAGWPMVAWRVGAQDGERVMPDRASVIERIAYSAVFASVPEPGLGLDFKNRKRDLEVVPDVLDLVRRQVVAGRAPTIHPLEPRRLVDVRGSGWATPWEMALLTARYLRQLKVDAVPLPVRPLSSGLADADNPAGYDEAVVLLRETGQVLVPSCRLCVLGEIPRYLQGANVLSDEIQALPEAPPGGRQRQARLVRSDQGWTASLSQTLTGGMALDLRQELLRYPVEQRPARVAALAGLSGALINATDGLTQVGEPIRIDWVGGTVATPVLPWELPEFSEQGSTQVVMPWVGEWRDEVVVVHGWMPMSVETVRSPGFFWAREIKGAEGGAHIVERLVIEWPIADRRNAQPFFAKVAAMRAQLPEPARRALHEQRVGVEDGVSPVAE